MTRPRFASWNSASLRFASIHSKKTCLASLRLVRILPRLASPRLASSGEDSTQIYFQSITHIRYMCHGFFCWWAAINESLLRLSDSASLSAKQTKNIATTRKKENWTTKIYSIWFFIFEKKINSIKIPILLSVSSDSDRIELVFSDWYKERKVWKSNAIRTTSSSSLSDMKVAKIYS